MASSLDEQVSYTHEPKIRTEDVNDGELALKVLHTSFEPYTAAEEKNRKGELPMLRSRVKDSRDMIEVAFKAALQHGNRTIVQTYVNHM